MTAGLRLDPGWIIAYSGESSGMAGMMTDIPVIAVLAGVIVQVTLESLEHRLLR